MRNARRVRPALYTIRRQSMEKDISNYLNGGLVRGDGSEVIVPERTFDELAHCLPNAHYRHLPKEAFHILRLFNSGAMQDVSRLSRNQRVMKAIIQGFALLAQGLSLCTSYGIPLLSEAYAQDEDITTTKLDALLLCTSFKILCWDGVSGPRVVRQGLLPIIGVELDHVQKNTAAADSVLRPV